MHGHIADALDTVIDEGEYTVEARAERIGCFFLQAAKLEFHGGPHLCRLIVKLE